MSGDLRKQASKTTISGVLRTERNTCSVDLYRVVSQALQETCEMEMQQLLKRNQIDVISGPYRAPISFTAVCSAACASLSTLASIISEFNERRMHETF